MADVDPEVQVIKDLRVGIDSSIQEVQNLLDELTKTGSFSRTLSLVKTKLEEAKMWGGKRFEELGRELPVEYQDKADTTAVGGSPAPESAPAPGVITPTDTITTPEPTEPPVDPTAPPPNADTPTPQVGPVTDPSPNPVPPSPVAG